MGNWISVNDRLPENDDRVLVWENKTYPRVLPPEYGYCNFAHYDGTWTDDDMKDYNNNSDWTVTHWMPLPPPPTL